jgi:hypothetical protein
VRGEEIVKTWWIEINAKAGMAHQMQHQIENLPIRGLKVHVLAVAYYDIKVIFQARDFQAAQAVAERLKRSCDKDMNDFRISVEITQPPRAT